MRVIITGSRYMEQADEHLIKYALESLTIPGSYGYHVTDLIVVHGDCPTGCDMLAETRVCPALGVKTEPHLAKWGKYGPKAGMLRNKEMAELGASWCLAFWDGRIYKCGTHDMIVQATEYGIHTKIIPIKKPEHMRAKE